MKKTMILLSCLLLFAIQGFSYTYDDLYENQIYYGSQMNLTNVIGNADMGNPVILSISMDAWNPGGNPTDPYQYFHVLVTGTVTNGGSISLSTGSDGTAGNLRNTDGDDQHTAYAVWTASSGQCFNSCNVEMYNKTYSGGSSSSYVWVRIGYYY
jgi:hypothetical protein